jgi:hypothetical protein
MTLLKLGMDTTGQWIQDIIAMMTVVLIGYVMLWEKFEHIKLEPLAVDRFIWRWTKNGIYTASLVHASFFFGMTSRLGAKKI